MSYSELLEHVKSYSGERRRSMDDGGSPAVKWFPEAYDSLRGMVDGLDSSSENSDVEAGYKTDAYPLRAVTNFKLGYVCAVRKDVRRLYCSGSSDPFTDVTPFRLGRESAAQAELFATVMKTLDENVTTA